MIFIGVNIKNISITIKLFGSVGVIVVIAAIIGIYALYGVNETFSNTEKLFNHPLKINNAVRDIKTDINEIHQLMTHAVLENNQEFLQKIVRKVDSLERTVQKSFELVFKRFHGDKRIIERANNTFKDWEIVREEIFLLLQTDKLDEARRITTEMEAHHVLEMTDNMNEMVNFASQKANDFYYSAKESHTNTLNFIYIVIILSLCIIVTVALILNQSTIRPIIKMKDELQSLLVMKENHERELEIAVRDVSERVKDLDCLYSLSQITNDPDISFEELLLKTVDLIPASWQYPEITCGRITFDKKVFLSMNFNESKWKLASLIKIENEQMGVIEVFYSKKMPAMDHGPFMTEEKNLIDSMCVQISDFYLKRLTEANLKRINLELEDALLEVESLRKNLEEENVYLQEEIKLQHNFDQIVGDSIEMKKTLKLVEKVAPSDSTVLIQGETGTGKELIARSIHNLSLRNSKPLVKVNCAALPSQLIESELFGYERGAFTGALQRRKGRFELADGGTIFLDEIGELAFETQSKLLRVLQEGEFERLGGNRTLNVNVRIIAATNKDLEAETMDNKFRQDLFYRLNVFPIIAPALRDRSGDIPQLAFHFAKKYGKKLGYEFENISKHDLDVLQTHNWPGNVRELENIVERSVIFSKPPTLQIDTTILTVLKKSKPKNGLITLEQMEHDYLEKVFKEKNWVISGNNGAAKILGLNESTLRSKMKKLGIKKPK